MPQTQREEVLRNPAPGDHAAHLYVNAHTIAEAVGWYVDGAFGRGAAVMTLAGARHTRRILKRLAGAGHDTDSLRASGQLLVFDAHDTLDQVMRDGKPNRELFNALLRPLIESAIQRFNGLAAYGELVDILWQQGKVDQAHVLETWWNDLIAEYGFTLLCGYKADPLDFREDVQTGIDRICSTHTHVIPVADYERLERALDQAMKQAFHNGDSTAIRRHLLDRRRRPAQMPAAQAALLGLHDILPSLAQSVRMNARDLYVQMADV